MKFIKYLVLVLQVSIFSLEAVQVADLNDTAVIAGAARSFGHMKAKDVNGKIIVEKYEIVFFGANGAPLVTFDATGVEQNQVALWAAQKIDTTVRSEVHTIVIQKSDYPGYTLMFSFMNGDENTLSRNYWSVGASEDGISAAITQELLQKFDLSTIQGVEDYSSGELVLKKCRFSENGNLEFLTN